ncbi:tight adherence protein C [Tissierella praeacuta DSM 18095]|uniref:Tight adherence protein C n=1 Tax=Tissierella praeacuta DSM 18095 TaxID=1123404 RepID=A0A1M4XJH7_9FIRM|nr:type II secretion system F family protein [Tissierella praeacuta]TCU67843.1 tight adherence protein C [Tissierella praeacuta]SHE93551.1 tight adherence protein C [Tissierella praeacuta DSM 18095]SUP02069.1 Flp pilus assembly protein TadB [Tissierella praeacuta]
MFIKPLLIGLSTYLIIVIISRSFLSNRKIFKKRLMDVKNVNKPAFITNDILDLSFQERFLKPMIDRFIQSVATLLPIKAESQRKLSQKLSKAGIRMNPKDYRAMNIIIIVGFALIGGYLGITKATSIIEIVLYMLVGIFAGYVYLRYSLETKITNRKKAIKAQLPEVMDILSVSVVAGLSFDQALGHVVEKSAGPLIDEFHIAQREISLGKTRKESLQALRDRCEIDEVNAFTSAVIQAGELGISMQNVLDSQSRMIRVAYKQNIEERAAKIPVKILIPMVLFIFPVIFIVLLAPAVPTIIEALGGI